MCGLGVLERHRTRSRGDDLTRLTGVRRSSGATSGRRHHLMGNRIGDLIVFGDRDRCSVLVADAHQYRSHGSACSVPLFSLARSDAAA
jgi:hypothetical protein